MAITVYPVPSASASAYTVTCAAINTQYKASQALSNGIYAVTVSPTSVVAKVDFWSSTALITSATTTSGSVIVNIASAVSYYIVSIDSSAGANVTVTLQSTSLPGTSLSGTLDTITTTSSYNQTGAVYVLAVGAGGGGSSAYVNNNGFATSGAGGGAGSINFAGLYLTTSTSVTIGAFGTNPGAGSSGNAGGATTFGSFLNASGGNGGTYTTNGGGGGTVGGGDGVYGKNAATVGNPGTSVANPYLSVKSGTNGGGGSGAAVGAFNTYSDKAGGVGAGSGIGTGGTGGSAVSSAPTTANAGSGYGAGGGGGAAVITTAGNGASGSAGVVYVLRGF